MKKIINAHICQIVNNQVAPVYGDLIFDENIIDIITTNSKQESYTIDEVYDACGRVLTIPNINSHDHIYSRIAKGLTIHGPMDNFLFILQNLWWKFDLLLDHKMIKACTQYAFSESIKNGVTYIFDHHASPNSTIGSLSVIADTVQDFGLRANLCFEISDRNGNELSSNALKESKEFLKKTNANIKTLLGMHASFTIDDATLQEVSEIVSSNEMGIHIHLCEDKLDREESLYKYKTTPVERLENFGLLNDKSILAHGNHLSQQDYKTIKKYGSSIVYNPESNLNNNVGVADYLSVPKDIPILCGTDGMHANVAKSLKQLFLFARSQGNSFEDCFNWITKIYFDQLNFVKKYFPDFSNLQKGDRADFILWDYIPPTPFNKENFWGHYIYAVLESNVKTVIQDGEYLLKDFELLNHDEGKISKEIKTEGNRLSNLFNNS